jgi:hypothetical protein
MSQRQLASVLFAVLGVFVAVTWLPQVFLQVGLLSQLKAGTAADDYGRVMSITYLISTGIAVLLGFGLVLSRDVLARRLFPSDSQPLVGRDTQAAALSVLGAYFVIVGICRLVARDEIEWSAIVELGLGLWLFLGARGIARLWTFARSAGVNNG